MFILGLCRCIGTLWCTGPSPTPFRFSSTFCMLLLMLFILTRMLLVLLVLVLWRRWLYGTDRRIYRQQLPTARQPDEVWDIACETAEQWRALCRRFARSTGAQERALYSTLTSEVAPRHLPAIEVGASTPAWYR